MHLNITTKFTNMTYTSLQHKLLTTYLWLIFIPCGIQTQIKN